MVDCDYLVLKENKELKKKKNEQISLEKNVTRKLGFFYIVVNGNNFVNDDVVEDDLHH